MVDFSKKLGYNINTGEPVKDWDSRMVHQGNGFYSPANEALPDSSLNQEMFFSSIDRELLKFKLGLSEK